MRTLCFVIIVVLSTKCLCADKARVLVHRDKPLTFPELAKANGYVTEEYELTTEDGYILRLFRIPGRRGLPLLLMHGIVDSSDSWLLRGNDSLGIALANKEYDVWFGNNRGNKYTRRHVRLDPDRDASFWDFSFNEIALYDLSATIDTILTKTGAPKLNAIAHSQGNTIFYVLGSSRPEYNEKINVLTALAPICYLNNLEPPLSWIVKIAPELNTILETVGSNELFGQFSPTGKIVDVICNRHLFRYPICAIGKIFPLTGFNLQEFEPAFYDIAILHFPDSTSRKNLYHFAQISRRGRFARYDYGPYRNSKEYASVTPPDYDLSLVTLPVVLLAGRNDKLAPLADVSLLNEQLPNVKNYTIISNRRLTHLDFIYGRHEREYLFPHIFYTLDNYGILS